MVMANVEKSNEITALFTEEKSILGWKQGGYVGKFICLRNLKSDYLTIIPFPSSLLINFSKFSMLYSILGLSACGWKSSQ